MQTPKDKTQLPDQIDTGQRSDLLLKFELNPVIETTAA
jgi:hypothetical protein